MVFNDGSPWDGILVSTMFALLATVHTTTQHTPAHLVFRQDSILNIFHKVNKQLIKKHKHDSINKGNKEENCNKKHIRTKKGIRSYSKMRRKPNSTKTMQR